MPHPAESSALETKLQILFEASTTLLGSLRMEELLPKVLDLARRLNAAEACAIWRQDPGAPRWRIVAASGLSPAFENVPLEAQGAGLGEQPFCFEDVLEAPPAADRRPLYEAEGIRSLMAMPMKIGGRLPGTLTFYYRQPHRFSENERRVAAALTNLAAAAIETAELNRAREQARVHNAFLAEASVVLASSLDYQVTLAAVARLAVPHIADWCVVDMAGEDGALRRLAVAHADPEKVALAHELDRKYPPDPLAPDGPPAVVRSGRPELVSVLTEEIVEKGARDAEHFELLRGLGLTSYMCVPLTVRDRVLGALTFVSANPGRHYDESDLVLAEDLARRAAMAIDNALLYASTQRERTALEAALAALRENEKRLLLAMEAGRLAIWDWNLETGEIEWTDNASATVGFSNPTFDEFVAAIHPEDRPGFLACVDKATTEKSYFECDFRITGADGGIRWIATKGNVVCADSGQAARIVGIGLDITERRLLGEKLRNAQKLESIGLLAGGIAHDFNNLLTGILGNASVARDILPPGHEAEPLLANVVQASERAADLTQQLLAYSGKGRFVVEPLDLSSLVAEITNLLEATIPKMVTLQLDLASDLPAIEADSSQIQQVIMNLVINGAEAIGDGPGTLIVQTSLRRFGAGETQQDLPAGDYVSLEVRDDGCGMDEATQSRIFDPFFTTKFTGRGLGLAAVSGIVRSHRGALHVNSAPGRGSSFEVLFAAMSKRVPVREPAREFEDLTGSGLVLVIDDENAVRSTAAAALGRYGYRVEVAHDGAAGVEAFRRHPEKFAAILLDLTMPVLGGEKTLARIREIRPQVPVVASSGHSEEEAVRRFGEVAAFLQKPYSGAALARAIKSVVLRGAGA